MSDWADRLAERMKAEEAQAKAVARKLAAPPPPPPPPVVGELNFGVDVARFGDDKSVIVGCRGPVSWLDPDGVMNGFDGVKLADRFLMHVARHRRNKIGAGGGVEVERAYARIDCTGGYGGALIDVLTDRRRWQLIDDALIIIPVVVSNTSDDPERYHSLRDQLWYAAREWVEDGGEMPDDKDLLNELAGARYFLDARSRNQVESKADMKQRIGRSPDKADAFCLSVYRGGKPDLAVVGERGQGRADLAPPRGRFR